MERKLLTISLCSYFNKITTFCQSAETSHPTKNHHSLRSVSRLDIGSDEPSDFRKNSCLSEIMERVLLFTKERERHNTIARPSAGALAHFWQEKSGYVKKGRPRFRKDDNGAGGLACDQGWQWELCCRHWISDGEPRFSHLCKGIIDRNSILFNWYYLFITYDVLLGKRFK